MPTLMGFLIVLALVLLFLAAFNITHRWVHFGWMGVFLALVWLIIRYGHSYHQ